MILLETPRLLLRKFTLEDAPFIIELLNSDGWLKYIGDRNVKTVDEAKVYLQQVMKGDAGIGFGFCHVALKEGNIPIGLCGFVKREELDHADIGFAFLPQYLRKGYGKEAAQACLDHGFSKLNMDRVLAITMAENSSSIALLKSLGMQFEKNIIMKEEELMLFSRNSVS
ncbi:MAG: hypothetical protein JWQ27_481 [Ferruginibacter sp.]|nr:hypothetical protein [Ferruginibacter sp.]